MAMSQERAILYDALQQSPHLTLVYREASTGIDHLLLHNSWDGWFTPCKVNLSAEEANLKNVRYGRPTCFECFADEDPTDVGRMGRNVLKLYVDQKGQHHHVVIFMGALGETLTNVGGVTMLTFEWKEFAAAMVVGALSLGMRVIIERRED